MKNLPTSLPSTSQGSSPEAFRKPEAWLQKCVVLLTKMVLSPNRNRFGWFGRLGRCGVSECVRWPSTVRSKQHVAWHDTLEATLWHDYLGFSAISRQTLIPKLSSLNSKLARTRLIMYMRARAARAEDPRPSVLTDKVGEGKACRYTVAGLASYALMI